MISYSSNINLNIANTIFNKYLSYLLHELSQNNQTLRNEITKITSLRLSSSDYNYIINALEQMENTNNTYIALLLSFQQEYTNFEYNHLHSIPYHSQKELVESLNAHLNIIEQMIF